MKLYKAKATVTVYFMADPKHAERKAEMYLSDELDDNGLDSKIVLTEVAKIEKPDGDWEQDQFVWGSDKLTGDEPLTFEQAMEILEGGISAAASGVRA